MKYPERYRRWRERDLEYGGSIFGRDPLWKALRAEDEERVWMYIEDAYLDKYRGFFKIWPEFDSSGIWKILYPGMREAPLMVSYEELGLPDSVCEQIKAWQDYFNEFAHPWEGDQDSCDYQKLEDWGLAVAKTVKLHTSEDFYFEYNPFRELVIRGNEVVEMEVPEFIRKLNAGSGE